MNYKLNETEMFADITDGTAIIINSVTGIYYGMNGYGTSLFENLLAGSSVEDIVAAAQRIPGYTEEMNRMLEANPGMKSRFPYIFHFDDYTPKE